MELDSDEELDNHLRVQEEGGGAGPSREPRKKSRAGGWSWVRKGGQRLLQLFLNSCFTDTVLVTLLRTAVDAAISEVHKSLRSGGVPTSLMLLFWRWLTVFAGRSYSLVRVAAYPPATLPPPTPFPRPYPVSLVASVDVTD